MQMWLLFTLPTIGGDHRGHDMEEFHYLQVLGQPTCYYQWLCHAQVSQKWIWRIWTWPFDGKTPNHFIITSQLPAQPEAAFSDTTSAVNIYRMTSEECESHKQMIMTSWQVLLVTSLTAGHLEEIFILYCCQIAQTQCEYLMDSDVLHRLKSQEHDAAL